MSAYKTRRNSDGRWRVLLRATRLTTSKHLKTSWSVHPHMNFPGTVSTSVPHWASHLPTPATPAQRSSQIQSSVSGRSARFCCQFDRKLCLVPGGPQRLPGHREVMSGVSLDLTWCVSSSSVCALSRTTRRHHCARQLDQHQRHPLSTLRGVVCVASQCSPALRQRCTPSQVTRAAREALSSMHNSSSSISRSLPGDLCGVTSRRMQGEALLRISCTAPGDAGLTSNGMRGVALGCLWPWATAPKREHGFAESESKLIRQKRLRGLRQYRQLTATPVLQISKGIGRDD